MYNNEYIIFINLTPIIEIFSDRNKAYIYPNRQVKAYG